jgi:hypothetical protein
MKDRLDRALRYARVAVDAVNRVDVELVLVLVKTITWTDDDAIGVFAIVARLTDDEGHGGSLLVRKEGSILSAAICERRAVSIVSASDERKTWMDLILRRVNDFPEFTGPAIDDAIWSL